MKRRDAADALGISGNNQLNVRARRDGAVRRGWDGVHGRHGQDAVAQEVQKAPPRLVRFFVRQGHSQAENCGFERDVLERLFRRVLLHSVCFLRFSRAGGFEPSLHQWVFGRRDFILFAETLQAS